MQQLATAATCVADARKDRLAADRHIFLNQQGAASSKERAAKVTAAIATAVQVGPAPPARTTTNDFTLLGVIRPPFPAIAPGWIAAGCLAGVILAMLAFFLPLLERCAVSSASHAFPRAPLERALPVLLVLWLRAAVPGANHAPAGGSRPQRRR